MVAVLRVYKCRDCEHRMRLFGSSCGHCFADKGFFQRAGVFIGALVALFLLAFMVLLAQII